MKPQTKLIVFTIMVAIGFLVVSSVILLKEAMEDVGRAGGEALGHVVVEQGREVGQKIKDKVSDWEIPKINMEIKSDE